MVGPQQAGVRSVAAPVLTAWAVPGIGEIRPGDDLSELIGDALAADAVARPDLRPRDGDVLVVTSKIVSKAEGRVVRADDREDAITAETVRVVATREHPGGVTRIVQNRLGLVMAAAGVDASNTEAGTVLLLPEDPDATARSLRAALRARFGVQIGVLVSDTAGRPWRQGQTDIAIGAAGVRVLDDLRGSVDAYGRPLQVSMAAVADEIAGAAELVKGKATGLPVAVVRGMAHVLTAEDGPGARALVRTGPEDMFAEGSAEAYARGWKDATDGASGAGPRP